MHAALHLNLYGLFAFLASLAAFEAARLWLSGKARRFQWMVLSGSALASVPALLFVVYYLHILPERTWFYAFRAWPGTEFVAVFPGIAAGAVAVLWPKLRTLALIGLTCVSAGPHLKPLIGPIPEKAFADRWNGNVCLQSTASTCGPASACTILKSLGANVTERALARASFSYSRGTEAWYLARAIRAAGFSVEFDFRRTFSTAIAFPAIVGVRVGEYGHFIAVLDATSERVRFADPLHGESELALGEFLRRYRPTGFHLTIAPARCR